MQYQGIWRFIEWLPLLDKKITMNEGNTPLLEISPENKSRFQDIATDNCLFFKNEIVNPTGSFRDRAAALVVSEAKSEHYDSVVVASDGNHAVSVAAYAAYAGLRCHCIVPTRTDIGKIRIMEVYGASIDKESEETLLGAIIRSNRYSEERASFQTSVERNPTCLRGQETLAYELASENRLSDEDYVLLVPTGSGSLIYSLWQGFKRLKKAERISIIPRLCAIQIVGYDPISTSLHEEKPLKIQEDDEFFISPLMVDFTQYKEKAVLAIKETKGDSFSINQKPVANTAVQLARNLGFFVENASAASIAALPSLKDHNWLSELPIVVLLTGSGIKTPELFSFRSQFHLEKSPTEFQPSSMKIAVLKLIKERQTASGRELWRLLGRKVSPQVVYQHLRDLKAKNFVQPIESEGRTKKYLITSRGKKLLEALED